MTSKVLCAALAISFVTGCGGSSDDHQNSPQAGTGGAAGKLGAGGSGATSGASTTGGSGGKGGSAGATQGGTGGSIATGGTGGSGASAEVGGTNSGATGGGAGKGGGGAGNAGSSGASGSAGGGRGGGGAGGSGGMSGDGSGGAGDAGASGSAGNGNKTCGGLSAKMCDVGEVCHWANNSCGVGDQPGECIEDGGGLCPQSPVCGCNQKSYVSACRSYEANSDITADKSCVPGDGASGDNCFVDDDCTGPLKCCPSPIGQLACTTPQGSGCPLTP